MKGFLIDVGIYVGFGLLVGCMALLFQWLGWL